MCSLRKPPSKKKNLSSYWWNQSVYPESGLGNIFWVVLRSTQSCSLKVCYPAASLCIRMRNIIFSPKERCTNWKGADVFQENYSTVLI